jgi:hypothetical protein
MINIRRLKVGSNLKVGHYLLENSGEWKHDQKGRDHEKAGSKDRSRGATAMTISTRSVTKKALLVSTAAVGAAGLFASPVAAGSTNDGFTAKTSNGCGSIEFVDYGPGVPGGSDNDDYTLVRDLCRDGHGIRAYVKVTTYGSSFFSSYSDTKYNGDGNGSSIVWDPFKSHGNVKPRDFMEMRVCLVDGESDLTPFSCGQWRSRTSADG